MSERVLVTEATGTVGRALLAGLTLRGAQPRAASRRAGIALGPVETVQLDWEQPGSWAAALEGAERLFLALPERAMGAAPVGPFLQQAVAAGVHHVVLLSALGVETEGQKTGMVAAEEAVRHSGIEWTILHPNTLMQAFSEGVFGRWLLERGEVVGSVGEARVSFVGGRDVAAAAAVVLTEEGHDGKVYELTGPEALTFAQAVAHISSVAGHRFRYVDLPPSILRKVLVASGVPEPRVDQLMLYFEGVRSGQHAILRDTVSWLIGRPPKRFATFAREHAARWFAAPEARVERPAARY